MRLRRDGGFSLLELLLALGTLATTLLLVVALGLSLAGRNRTTASAPIGFLAAENILNQFVYDIQGNSSPSTFFSTPPPAVHGTLTVNRIDFLYRLDYELCSGVGPAPSLSDNRLLKLTVKVTWTLGNGPQQGKHECTLMRLLHENT